jgi:LmbE family N-acetylglucosaminyl deacetylase
MAKVLFAGAHPDDEVLMSCVAIVEHVLAGHDVHVVTLCRSLTSVVYGHLNGTSTSSWWGVPHVPADEGYEILTPDEFGAARIHERDTAINCLRSGIGSITTHETLELINGFNAQQATDALRTLCDEINPGGPVWLKSHSQIVDDHPEHIALGQAIEALKSSDVSRFGNIRHYILPRYWNDPRLAQVAESWDWPTNASVAARAVNALRAYGAWDPPNSYAIGYHSVYPDMFAPLLNPPGVRNMYHP